MKLSGRSDFLEALDSSGLLPEEKRPVHVKGQKRLSLQRSCIPDHEPLELPDLKEFRIRWPVLISILSIHLLAIPAFWTFTPDALYAFLFLWFATGCWGITVGYHRMISHRAFSAPPWVRAFHLFWAALSMQQGPISWARQHRAHHKYSDTMADPHPQKYGFFFGHIGWAFLAHRFLGRSPERKEVPLDLLNDPLLVFFERFHLWFLFGSLVGLYVLGGWPWFFWAGALRLTFVLHITWAINSVVHRWGYRSFETNDSSVNNPLMGLLAWGEGWHNNHHRYPFSARQGFRWWEVDFSWWWIKALRLLRLANAVKTSTAVAIDQHHHEPLIPSTKIRGV